MRPNKRVERGVYRHTFRTCCSITKCSAIKTNQKSNEKSTKIRNQSKHNKLPLNLRPLIVNFASMAQHVLSCTSDIDERWNQTKTIAPNRRAVCNARQLQCSNIEIRVFWLTKPYALFFEKDEMKHVSLAS